MAVSFFVLGFDYQSNRHCAKTITPATDGVEVFDYQSNRHCAKTRDLELVRAVGLITSQIDTAPKRHPGLIQTPACLITSQIDTAPKPNAIIGANGEGLITSQIDTAPKRACASLAQCVSLITSQIDTAPKHTPQGRKRKTV